MNSSVVTGGVTLSAATLAPYVQWLMFHGTQPIDAPLLIAAAIITGAHALYNVALPYLKKEVPHA